MTGKFNRQPNNPRFTAGIRNNKHKLLQGLSGLFVLVVVIVLSISCNRSTDQHLKETESSWGGDGRPYTRWWWFASEINREDIKDQLDWLKEQHFGGVEIAFIYPVNRDPEASRVSWLGPEWTRLVTYTKQYCDSIGLGCDFTFGTLWPFGGTFVADSDRTKIFGEPEFKQPLRLSWTHPDTGNVIDHMSKGAFDRYGAVMGEALAPALTGTVSALFCDSWEVETKKIWTDGFGHRFKSIYGYTIEPYMEELFDPENAGPRYDYMKLAADFVLDSFYIPFTEKCHSLNAISRVQCAGSPTDILTAYATVDIPETEAMLYNPNFSRVVASAAAIAHKPVISAETFTCLYGWPANHIREEQTADLKLVADALFANGTNHIIWHGTPFNPAGIDSIYFYASVHVGRKGMLSKDLASFNRYLEKVASQLRKGYTYSDIAVYIPQEDAWIAGELPPEKQLPWAWGEYEMRYVEFPDELAGFHPLWVNNDFLSTGALVDGELDLNGTRFKALYMDVKYIDPEALGTILRIARQGFPVCLKRRPVQAGHISDPHFDEMLVELESMKNVSGDLAGLTIGPPLLEGHDLPEFWCRQTTEGLLIFLAHPGARDLTYPLSYGQALDDRTYAFDIVINYGGKRIPTELVFKPYQSILLTVSGSGQVSFRDIEYLPPAPVLK